MTDPYELHRLLDRVMFGVRAGYLPFDDLLGWEADGQAAWDDEGASFDGMFELAAPLHPLAALGLLRDLAASSKGLVPPLRNRAVAQIDAALAGAVTDRAVYDAVEGELRELWKGIRRPGQVEPATELLRLLLDTLGLARHYCLAPTLSPDDLDAAWLSAIGSCPYAAGISVQEMADKLRAVFPVAPTVLQLVERIEAGALR